MEALDSTGARVRGQWQQLRAQFELPASTQLPLCLRLHLGPASPSRRFSTGAINTPWTRGVLRFGGLGLGQIPVLPLTRSQPVRASVAASAGNTQLLTDGVTRFGPGTQWLLAGVGRAVTFSLQLPQPHMVCALAVHWLTVGAWGLRLSRTSAAGSFREVISRTGPPDSASANSSALAGRGGVLENQQLWFDGGCVLAQAASLELRRPRGGQYGLSEITLYGYAAADGQPCRLACARGGSCFAPSGGDAAAAAAAHGGDHRPTASCQCVSAWHGPLCDVDVDECATANGGGVVLLALVCKLSSHLRSCENAAPYLHHGDLRIDKERAGASGARSA
eukprot:COSAG01_NODE_2677_length_7264_cov_2.780321_2_plen_335_part_00